MRKRLLARADSAQDWGALAAAVPDTEISKSFERRPRCTTASITVLSCEHHERTIRVGGPLRSFRGSAQCCVPNQSHPRMKIGPHPPTQPISMWSHSFEMAHPWGASSTCVCYNHGAFRSCHHPLSCLRPARRCVACPACALVWGAPSGRRALSNIPPGWLHTVCDDNPDIAWAHAELGAKGYATRQCGS